MLAANEFCPLKFKLVQRSYFCASNRGHQNKSIPNAIIFVLTKRAFVAAFVSFCNAGEIVTVSSFVQTLIFTVSCARIENHRFPSTATFDVVVLVCCVEFYVLLHIILVYLVDGVILSCTCSNVHFLHISKLKLVFITLTRSHLHYSFSSPRVVFVKKKHNRKKSNSHTHTYNRMIETHQQFFTSSSIIVFALSFPLSMMCNTYRQNKR